MADSSSYRSSRGGALPPGRDGASSDPARQALSDPLAELARLIGQDEAFGAIVRSSAREESRSGPARQPDPPSWRGRAQPAEERDHRAPAQPSYGYADTRYAVEPESHAAHDYGYEQQAHAAAYDPHGYDPGHADAAAHGETGHAQPTAASHADDAGGEYYGEGEGQDGHYEGEEDYADPVPQRRRGALVMAAAAIGLALVGTAGAFGYWAWSTGPRGEPPLIKADTTPNKVVPATPGDAAGSKRIYDRFGDQGASSEKVVPREETPVEIKSAPPRQVYPSAGGVYGPAPTQPTGTAPMAAVPAAAPPSGVSANGEPHRVRTETIRPSQVAAADIGQPVAPPLAAAPAAPPSPPPVAAAPAKQPPSRAKQAALPATPPTDAAPPAHEAAPTGGYVVQLSSQKSEEEARASFKVLASKYASVFGDREPYIKHVNIPGKGTFYRANVGPFATASEANHFCSNLKIVGGQCIVQKN